MEFESKGANARDTPAATCANDTWPDRWGRHLQFSRHQSGAAISRSKQYRRQQQPGANTAPFDSACRLANWWQWGTRRPGQLECVNTAIDTYANTQTGTAATTRETAQG